MSLRPSLLLLLASGCVSEGALTKAAEAFDLAFGPTDVVSLDGGSRCEPSDVVFAGTVHPGYQGQDLAAEVTVDGEASLSVELPIQAKGNWSLDTAELPELAERLVCPSPDGACVLEVRVRVTSEEEQTYTGTSAFEVSIEEDREALYVDGDGDGYGDDAADAQLVCDPTGYTDRQGDCDDADANVHEGIPADGCDGVDSDCNGDVDDGAVFTNYYPDLDGDGYGAEGSPAELRCDTPGAEEALAPNDADCVDDPAQKAPTTARPTTWMPMKMAPSPAPGSTGARCPEARARATTHWWRPMRGRPTATTPMPTGSPATMRSLATRSTRTAMGARSATSMATATGTTTTPPPSPSIPTAKTPGRPPVPPVGETATTKTRPSIQAQTRSSATSSTKTATRRSPATRTRTATAFGRVPRGAPRKTSPVAIRERQLRLQTRETATTTMQTDTPTTRNARQTESTRTATDKSLSLIHI